MNIENTQNAKLIYNFLKSKFGTNSSLNILDVCCGAFTNGTNYDKMGLIYEPVVAEYLGQKGCNVTGLDLRENKQKVHYSHISDIDILEPDWIEKVYQNLDSLIFLRSWDTPEILLHFQKLTGIMDVNTLTLKIAEYFLPQFCSVLRQGGLFFTTDIISPELSEYVANFELARNSLEKLFTTYGFKEIFSENGLMVFETKSVE